MNFIQQCYFHGNYTINVFRWVDFFYTELLTFQLSHFFKTKKSLSRGFVWYIEIRTHWGLRDDRVLFSGHKWRDQTEKIPQKDKDRTSALVLHVWIRKSTGFYATQDHQDIFVNITTCLYTWSKTFSFYSPDKH